MKTIPNRKFNVKDEAFSSSKLVGYAITSPTDLDRGMYQTTPDVLMSCDINAKLKHDADVIELEDAQMDHLLKKVERTPWMPALSQVPELAMFIRDVREAAKAAAT